MALLPGLTRKGTFEVFRGRNKQWYWRLRASNGRIVADGGESYVTRYGAKRGARRFADLAFNATIVIN